MAHFVESSRIIPNGVRRVGGGQNKPIIVYFILIVGGEPPLFTVISV